ncbi:MAG: hypothetical protein R3F65_10475 [bacterium]
MKRPLLALAALAALAGCEDLFELPDTGTLPRDMFVDNAALAGRWTITGTGDLRCPADPDLAIDGFRLETASFVVAQDEAGALTVPDPPRTNDGEFAFEDGEVSGLIVRFATREETAGTTIRLAFSGRANAIGNVSGTFTGDGPRTCTSRGSFDVEITR